MKRFEGNFSLGYLVKFSFESFTTQKDWDETQAFFEVKSWPFVPISIPDGPSCTGQRQLEVLYGA